MMILPAIDLRGGNVVRLKQGRYDRETVFGDDPVAVATAYAEQGARWIHVVDLDGAREGEPKHLEKVRDVVRAVEPAGVQVELGGGMRTREAVEEALGTGLTRVIVGTKAIRDAEWFREITRALPRRVALGLDARDGNVAVEGWESQTQIDARSVVEMFRDLPVAAIIYTDIGRDGMMSGPNVAATAALSNASPWPVVASGGVASPQDVRRLADAGLWGAIVGRALYEGSLTVAEAIAVAGKQE